MKRILTILFCSAAIMAFAGNDKKTQSANAQEPQTEYCIHIDAETFINKVADINQAEWKYLGDKPAIVDFYADWCGPCKMIAPSLEEIAAAYGDKIYVYKVNVDEAQEIAEAFNISAIPTLLFIPMEGKAYKNVGYIEKEQIEKLISEHLLK